MRIDSSGNIRLTGTAPNSEDNISTINFFNSSSGINLASITGKRTAGGTNYGSLIFNTTSSGTAAERMRIDSSGNLLVGTTSTTFSDDGIRLYEYGSIEAVRASYPVMHLNRRTSDGDIAKFYKDGTTVGSIRSISGDSIGIGNGDAGLRFVSSTNRIQPVDMDNGLNSDGLTTLGDTNKRFKDLYLSGDVIASGTPSSSVVGVRVNNSGSNFDLINTSCGSATTVKTHILFTNGNGNVGTIQTNGSTTSYNTSSDQRLKENIADADDAGSKIDAIQVRKYDWKADGSHQKYGMIAQELVEVAPEAVSVPEDSEEMMGVDYSKLVPMLIKEIQSLRNRVAQLEE
jgi:hypothetical protein